jgi:cytochrome c peroxidase
MAAGAVGSGTQLRFGCGVFQELFDFPPAPKLDIFGRLDPKKATEAEIRGLAVFFGKGRLAERHQPSYYTDNLIHNCGWNAFINPR